MGIFTTNGIESKKLCLVLTEDFRGYLSTLPLERKLIVYKKDGKPILAWPYDSRLLVPLKMRVNGKVKDYGLVYPISTRNAIVDPVGVTGDDLVGDQLWQWVKSVALEEFHFARNKKALSTMEKIAIPLSIAAGLMVVIIALIGASKMYGD